MPFYADLHVHSKYTRGARRDSDLTTLALWARRRGVAVLGTGDCLHPAWQALLRANLVPAEPGLWRLRPPVDDAVNAQLPPTCRASTRFVLSAEVASAPQERGAGKLHALVHVPTWEALDTLQGRLLCREWRKGVRSCVWRLAPAPAFSYVLPLQQILSETLHASPAAKHVAQRHEQALARLGPELTLLTEVPPG